MKKFEELASKLAQHLEPAQKPATSASNSSSSTPPAGGFLGLSGYFIQEEKKFYVTDVPEGYNLHDAPKILTAEEERQIYRNIRKGYPNGGHTFFLPPTITAERQSRMDSTLDMFVSRSLQIHRTAFEEFQSRRGGTGENTFKGEQTLNALFQDMKAHSRDWFTFLEDNCQYLWAEQGVALLGTLATIHRNRLKLENKLICRDILILSERLLVRLQGMIDAARVGRIPGADAHTHQLMIDNFDIGYKYFRIKIHLWSDVWAREDFKAARVDFDEVTPIFRKMIEYELRNGLDEFSAILKLIKKPVNLTTLNGLTAAQTRRMLLLYVEDAKTWNIKVDRMKKSNPYILQMIKSQEYRCALGKCSNCSKEEPSLGKFLKCARCHAQRYCGRECQVTHWKTHKDFCKEKDEM